MAQKKIEEPGPNSNAGDLWEKDPRDDDANDGQRKKH